MKNNHSKHQAKLPKTEKLRAMRAKLDKMLASHVGLNDPAARKLSEDIHTLKNSFLLYQGREIEASVVNYISCDIPTKRGDMQGDEDLYRDAQGRYYLRRCIERVNLRTADERETSGRPLVHRIGLNAAILWATTRLNCTTTDLCDDAAALLMEGRFYHDPNPSHIPHGEPGAPFALPQERLGGFDWLDGHARKLISERLAGEPDLDVRDLLNGALDYMLGSDSPIGDCAEASAWSIGEAKARRPKSSSDDESPEAKQSQATLSGDTVTVPLTLPLPLYRRILAMGAYDNDADFSATIADSMEGDVECWLESSNGLHPETPMEKFLKQYERELDAGKHPDVYPPKAQPAPLVSVAYGTLDQQASALVARYLKETPWGYEVSDIINGAVCQALSQAFKSLDEELGGVAPTDEGFYDGGWGYVEEDIFHANQRREGGNLITWYKGLGPNPLDASAPVAEPVVTREAHRVDDGCQHFTFTYPPKARVCGLRREIKLDTEQMALAQKLAAPFGLTVRAFLKKLMGHTLPGQPRRELAVDMAAQHIAFECFDEEMKRRIERAAQAANKTVDAFVAEAVAGTVDSYEADIIVHPQTGALLCADRDELLTVVSHDVTAPPRNGSKIKFAVHPQREAGREHVRFSAWLTPEQIDLLVYPREGHEAESGRTFAEVMISFDLEGEPQLLVGKDERLLDLTKEEAAAMRETKPPVNGHGERQPLAKPVFLLNAPRPKLPKV